MQVVIGGVTRLTGSGLSITKWEIVTGTLPPMNAAVWEAEFDLYKATPQYQKINVGMSMSEFKFIYFWEYFHRLWARSMGFVFLIPFLIFWRKGMLPTSLRKDLGIVVLLAAVVATFGWIMVASGLIDRPWVNAYKLTLHLNLALLTFSYLLWTTLKVTVARTSVIHNSTMRKWITGILVILGLQLFLGGIMSGMKAALYYPTWPDMHGVYVPETLYTPGDYSVQNLIDYDKKAFAPALIQFLHRNLGYLLFFSGLFFFVRSRNIQGSSLFHILSGVLISLLIIQVLLGIFTLLGSQGSIPVDLGVYHQIGAILVLGTVISLLYLSRDKVVM